MVLHVPVNSIILFITNQIFQNITKHLGGGLQYLCARAPGIRTLIADGSLPNLSDGRPVGFGGVLTGGKLSGEGDGLSMTYEAQ
jgi:hypothetical protein